MNYKSKPKYSKEDIEKRIPKHIKIIGEYVNTNTKTLFKCTLDGYTWVTLPRDVCQGHGCPQCKINNARQNVCGLMSIF